MKKEKKSKLKWPSAKKDSPKKNRFDNRSYRKVPTIHL